MGGSCGCLAFLIAELIGNCEPAILEQSMYCILFEVTASTHRHRRLRLPSTLLIRSTPTEELCSVRFLPKLTSSLWLRPIPGTVSFKAERGAVRSLTLILSVKLRETMAMLVTSSKTLVSGKVRQFSLEVQSSSHYPMSRIL